MQLYSLYTRDLPIKQFIKKLFFWVFVVAAFVSSCFLAWHDEHQNTTNVILEKSQFASAATNCESELKATAATLKGKEELATSLQATVSGLQAPEAQQQATINSCVVALGKMNPLIKRKNTVISIPTMTRDANSNRQVSMFFPHKLYIFELVLTSNEVESRAAGNLHCEQAFEVISRPQLPVLGSGLIGSGQSQRISDREYEIRIFDTASEWGPNSPIYLSVSSAEESFGACSFTPS